MTRRTAYWPCYLLVAGLSQVLAEPSAPAPSVSAAPAKPLATISVIANKIAEPLAEVAGTVSVIERQRIDQIVAADIKDLLRYEPGVSVNEDSVRFGAQSISIRGIDGNRIAIEVDGVPITDGFSVGSFSRASRDLVDPELLERVEILRGPASTLYGSDALGGVIAYQTRDPQAFLDQGDGKFYVGARLRSGSSDHSRLLTATSAVAAGDWGLLFSASDRNAGERENFARPGGLDANPARVRDRLGLAKIHWHSERAGNFDLVAEDHRSHNAVDVQSLVAGPGQFATTTSLLADDLAKRDRLSLSWQQALRFGPFDQITQRFYSQDTDFNQRTTQHRRGATATAAATLRERQFHYAQATDGSELIVDGERQTGALKHRLVAGFEWVENRLREQRDGTETNLRTGAVSHVIIGEVLPVRDFPNSKTRELGGFVQDAIAVTDRFTLTPGLRYESYRVTAQVDATWLADNPGVPVVNTSEDQITPKLGLAYQLNDRITGFVQYARGFRAPPFSDVNIGFDIPAFGFSAIPNPDLKSETSNGLEAGIRWTSARSSGSLTGYDNRYHNLIESRVNLGTNPDTGLLVFQSLNRQRAEIWGAELAADVGLDDWLGSGFELHTALAYTRGTDTARQRPLNTIDPAKAVLGLSHTSASGRHRLEGVATAVAAKHRVDSATTPLFQSPGFVTLDAFYSWHPGARTAVNLGLFNLANRRYWQWGTVRGLAANAREVDLASEPGRHAALSISLGW
ncbi:MAG: hypothetical protein COS34_09720 [Lysobacterales bacterium CG02_land_8_20_14_3_00_62_12]|nr:MAG: hypothetical protein COS34_09720 [Xanthomonadales bacterium CG02_land_8_20_14_3_00_62_12]